MTSTVKKQIMMLRSMELRLKPAFITDGPHNFEWCRSIPLFGRRWPISFKSACSSIQCGRSVDDMARHAPHRCRIARNPTTVHSALGERLTCRLLQVQRSLSKESQTSAVTCPPQPDNSASRDDQPWPRSLTTTSHPRVSGVLRYAGDLQHRSGQPAHQYRVHAAAAGSGRALFDGRSRSLSGQCVHQAVFIKRLWRSLKYEAVYLHQLADGFMAQRVIDEWSSSPLLRCAPKGAVREYRLR